MSVKIWEGELVPVSTYSSFVGSCATIQQHLHAFSELFGMIHHYNTGSFKGIVLRPRIWLTWRRPGSGMAHHPPRRCFQATYKSHDGSILPRVSVEFCPHYILNDPHSLWSRASPVVILDPLCSIYLRGSAHLSDENDSVSVWVVLEDLEGIHEIRSRKHVAPHADAKTLSEAGSGC